MFPTRNKQWQIQDFNFGRLRFSSSSFFLDGLGFFIFYFFEKRTWTVLLYLISSQWIVFLFINLRVRLRCLFLYNIGELGAFLWLVKLFPGALIMCLKPEQITCVFISGEGPTLDISGRMSKLHIPLYFPCS